MIIPQETFCQLKLACIYIVFFLISFFHISNQVSNIKRMLIKVNQRKTVTQINQNHEN